MANENYEGFDLTIYNLFTLLREMYYTRGETETNFLSKSGGTLGGSLTIQGNLTVQGNSYKIDTEDLVVKDYTITLAKDNEQALLSMVGMVVPKYDGTNYGFFGWDADGYAYVGDLDNWDGSSAITLANNSSLQKIATIKDTATGTTSDDIMVYDQTNKVFKKAPSGRYVIEDNELVASNDNNALYNIGAYDTYSVSNGKVSVVRQTGYYKFNGSENWTLLNTSDNYLKAYVYFNNNYLKVGASELPNAISNYFDFVIQTNYNQASNHLWLDASTNNSYNIGISISTSLLSSADITGLKQYLSQHPLNIQYKLSTSYTETYIENTPNIALDQNGANWLQNEWKKGLNLFNINNVFSGTNYSISGNSVVVNSGSVIYQLNVKANTKYYFSSDNASYHTIASDRNGDNVLRVNDGVFDSGNNTTIYILIFGTLSNIILVEANHPYPYQEYNGEIVHKADIEPVLLWENSSPNSAYSQTTETVKDMSDFKYIIITYKHYKSWKDMQTIKICRNGSPTSSYSSFMIYSINMAADEICSRRGYFESATQIKFDTCQKGASSANDDLIIPIAIYGTNVL